MADEQKEITAEDLHKELEALKAKNAEFEKLLESERNEKKEIIAKRDAAKSRQKELEDKLTLTESEKAELQKLADAKEAKIAEIENSTKAELLSDLDESHKKIAEKLSLMDLREYVKLNGTKGGHSTQTKVKSISSDEKKPNSYRDYKNSVENVTFN